MEYLNEVYLFAWVLSLTIIVLALVVGIIVMGFKIDKIKLEHYEHNRKQ
jgi:hypothetical protein